MRLRAQFLMLAGILTSLLLYDLNYVIFAKSNYGTVTNKSASYLNERYKISMSTVGTGYKDRKIDKLIYNFHHIGNADRSSMEKLIICVAADILAIANSAKGFANETYSFPLTTKNLELCIFFNNNRGIPYKAPLFCTISLYDEVVELEMDPVMQNKKLSIKENFYSLVHKHKKDIPEVAHDLLNVCPKTVLLKKAI